MLRFTGEEANGWQVAPGVVQTAAFVFMLLIVLMHVFTKGTPYRSVNPLIKDYYEPPV